MIELKQEKRILLDGLDINWEFTRWETVVFQVMWRKGKSLEEVAEELDRPPLEIGLLVIEQAELGAIKQRGKGVENNEESIESNADESVE